MKVLKISVLLALFLAAMRLASWAVAWGIRRAGVKPRAAAMLANVICFAAFSGWLFYDLLPGEPIDWGAVLFGAAVFGAYAALDLMSIKRKARAAAAAAR
jgi:hypothetical protein